jgi:hypothetical protein
MVHAAARWVASFEKSPPEKVSRTKTAATWHPAKSPRAVELRFESKYMAGRRTKHRRRSLRPQAPPARRAHSIQVGGLKWE